jgi:dolichyl-phosphate beta-glucosyltransferase
MISSHSLSPVHSILIVVPCYNERTRLVSSEFARFVQHHPEVGFVFVNDGSTDGTEGLLRALCRTSPSSLRSITLDQHMGKGEAVRRGILDVLAVPGVRFVGYWDADLATPLETICAFVRVYDEHPGLVLVMGARVQLLGRCITRNALRHYLGRIFATAASMILALPVYDTQCGAKLFRAEDLTRKVFQEPFGTRWIFDVEILARMIRYQRLAKGSSIEHLVYEFPLLNWHDVDGSRRKPSDYLLAVRDLLLIRRSYRRKGTAERPGVAIGESVAQELVASGTASAPMPQ